MSHASLKEQLQAVASQLSETFGKEKAPTPKKKHRPAPPQASRSVEKAKKPKPRWLDYVQYGVELLKVYFPACFKSANEVKPLKKGIKQDLVKRLSSLESVVTEDKACMVKSLAYYVNTSAYHRVAIEGATRIDLDGGPAGLVTAEEAQYSAERHRVKEQKRALSLAVAPNKKEEIAQ